MPLNSHMWDWDFQFFSLAFLYIFLPPPFIYFHNFPSLLSHNNSTSLGWLWHGLADARQGRAGQTQLSLSYSDFAAVDFLYICSSSTQTARQQLSDSMLYIIASFFDTISFIFSILLINRRETILHPNLAELVVILPTIGDV